MIRLLLLALLALAAPSFAAEPLKRQEDFMGVRVMSVTGSAQLVTSTGTGGFWGNDVNERRLFCAISEGTYDTDKIYLSTFSVTDETTYGWPVLAKSSYTANGATCFNWGPNIPIYAWRASGGNNQTCRFMIAR